MSSAIVHQHAEPDPMTSNRSVPHKGEVINDRKKRRLQEYKVNFLVSRSSNLAISEGMKSFADLTDTHTHLTGVARITLKQSVAKSDHAIFLPHIKNSEII